MRADLEVPWSVALTSGEHQLILYALLVAALAFLAGLIRTFITRAEVGPRYRSAVTARLSMLAVALASYLLIATSFVAGYDETPDGWVPGLGAIDAFAARYVGWTVTVPLLTIELLAVCAIVGSRARRSRAITLVASVLMIVSGFLGGIVVEDGTSVVSFLLWALVSCGFLAVTVAVLVRAVQHSRQALTPESYGLLSRATVALLAGWLVYPIVYLLPLLGASGVLTTTIFVTLTVADVTIKLVFSTQIHRVAKLRTAEDVRAGVDVHPESIWISSVKQSDAGLPREVYLADGEAIHERRPKPPSSTATASTDPESTGY